MNRVGLAKIEKTVRSVLAQPELNGVYRLSHPGIDFMPVLDGRIMVNKQTFLIAVGQALEFPDYYGKNWDALEECLSDMNWHTGPIALLIKHAEMIPASVLSLFLEIFDPIAAQWALDGRACSLFLCGLENADIPSLA